MRRLHPVQAHERFVASGCYRFFKDGNPLAKTEAWTLHALPDGERMLRVDLNAIAEEDRSILAEALLERDGALARFDLRYENGRAGGSIQRLQATYQLASGRIQVGYRLNEAAREYREMALPPATLIDLPLLFFRGRAIEAMARQGGQPLSLFVPMFEHWQLFPGIVQTISPPVQFAGREALALGRQRIQTRRYRYTNRAAAYWIDERGVIIRRVSAYKQSEMSVQISNYAAPPA